MRCEERGGRPTVVAPTAMALEAESVAMEVVASCVVLRVSASMAPEALLSVVFEATETEVLATGH